MIVGGSTPIINVFFFIEWYYFSLLFVFSFFKMIYNINLKIFNVGDFITKDREKDLLSLI